MLYMNSKVIALPVRRKLPVLSRLMIVSLIEAGVRQQRGIPFGPADIKGGSFGALITRGIVVHTDVVVKNRKQSLWQVTSEGLEILRGLGINLHDYQ